MEQEEDEQLVLVLVRGSRLFLLRSFHRGHEPTRDAALLQFYVVVDNTG